MTSPVSCEPSSFRTRRIACDVASIDGASAMRVDDPGARADTTSPEARDTARCVRRDARCGIRRARAAPRVSVARAAAARSGNAPAPTAASSAAPYAGPSSRFTVLTGRPNTSACSRRRNALFAPPPVSSSWFGDSPSSWRIDSESRSAKQTPSSTARVRCARVCARLSPRNAPRADASRCGVRSPCRYGRNVTPSAPGGIARRFRVEPRVRVGRRRRARARAGRDTRRTRRPPRARRPSGTTCPGATWQNVCARSRGSTRGSAVGASTVPDVPQLATASPGAIDADARGAARVVRAAADDRRARREPGDAPPPRASRGRAPPTSRRRPAASDRGSSDRAQDLVAPAQARRVVHQRRRRVRRLGRERAREAIADEVLRQQHRREPRERLGLVVAQPEHLRAA